MGTVYLLHGLRVRSEAPLAGVVVDGPEFDLDVQWGPAAPVGDDCLPGRTLIEWVQAGRRCIGTDDGDAFTLRVPSCADFVVDRNLQRIVCRPDPRVDPGLVPLLVAGVVISLVLRLAGHFVLHASAVEVDGAVTAFAGRSGSGKSTLAALLCGSGARLVTDDVLRIETNGRVTCVGGSPQLRLRPHAAWAYDGPSTPTADGRLAVGFPRPESRAIPLGAIVLPRVSRTANEVALRRLSGGEAFARLAVLTRVLGWREASAQRDDFSALARIIRDVRVVEATIPWGPDRVEPAVAALLKLA